MAAEIRSFHARGSTLPNRVVRHVPRGIDGKLVPFATHPLMPFTPFAATVTDAPIAPSAPQPAEEDPRGYDWEALAEFD